MSELAQTVPNFDIPEGILPGEGYNLKKNYDEVQQRIFVLQRCWKIFRLSE